MSRLKNVFEEWACTLHTHVVKIMCMVQSSVLTTISCNILEWVFSLSLDAAQS